MSYSITLTRSFNARGLRRCAVPGVGVGLEGRTASVADFWQGLDGTVWMRVKWMGYPWSFPVFQDSGESIPNEAAPLESFANYVAQELHRWMTEDAADLAPFDDC